MKMLALDIGGVFYLGRPDDAFWTLWSRRCGVPAGDLQNGFWFGPDIEACNVGEMAPADFYARTADRIGITAENARDLTTAAFTSDLNDVLLGHVRSLKRAGTPVVAWTNSWSSQAELQARAEFQGLFDAVVSSRDVGLTKPGAAFFQHALEGGGVEASDVVFLDDTAANVATALELGIDAHHFVKTSAAIEFLEQRFG